MNKPSNERNAPEDEAFEALLDYVKRSRGFDFTGYKRSSLMRRVTKRMQMIDISNYSDYQDYLEVHPDEFIQLFNTLLINVTAFFRDPPAWDFIAREVIPQILARKSAGEPIRIWSAGCASGEEVYSIAILLREALGAEHFHERVKIYATDVDEEALLQARQATYLERDLETLTPEQREIFFERTDNRYMFRKDLRRVVIFGRHDLIQDAPISKIDLLICRNTLMYFNAETQSRILARFHFALHDAGFLFLGKAEMLLTHSNTFSPVQIKCRVFTKVPKPNLRDRMLIMAQTGQEDVSNNISTYSRLREAAFDSSPVARIVFDKNGQVVLVNERARHIFSLTNRDVGRPIQDLELSYRPVELRSIIEQATNERHPVILRDVELPFHGEILFLDISVTPLVDSVNTVLGVCINFIDVTRNKRLQEELEHANQELEMAYEELQSTNEELETTNEELQSSNEELETTNEELQSTNEELETINEELQSTNEELQTINDELQRTSDELNQNNAFLASIFASLKGGVVVVDQDFRILSWSHKAEDLWGLRSEEAVEQNFLNLDIGLPVQQLRQSIRECLSSDSEVSEELTLPAVNRRGRRIQCRVTCTPLVGSQSEVCGAILIMEDRTDAEV